MWCSRDGNLDPTLLLPTMVQEQEFRQADIGNREAPNLTGELRAGFPLGSIKISPWPHPDPCSPPALA